MSFQCLVFIHFHILVILSSWRDFSIDIRILGRILIDKAILDRVLQAFIHRIMDFPYSLPRMILGVFIQKLLIFYSRKILQPLVSAEIVLD